MKDTRIKVEKMQDQTPYQPSHKIRIVTAASLFDGHDASINIMRRILQASGAEVIHLGHNRPAQDIVHCAIQEDAQAIAVTSYQGGHMEFFCYMYDLLREKGCGHIKLFGGGGGTILPSEIEALHQYGINRIYSPDDGRSMGLQGMINDLLRQCDFPTGQPHRSLAELVCKQDHKALAQAISVVENQVDGAGELMGVLEEKAARAKTPVLGITGTGGAGKSSLTDELIRRFLFANHALKLAVISVDPSKRKSGGALLGDRIRMNAVFHPQVYMRSMATRQMNLALSGHVKEAITLLKAAHFDLIVLESSGIGQSDTEIVDFSDLSLYVMTPEFGAASQLEKIDMLDFADFVAINKFDKQGAADALRDVRKQVQRNRQLWDQPLDQMPVFGTMASHFADQGVDALFQAIARRLGKKHALPPLASAPSSREKQVIIPSQRVRYLAEIAEKIRGYNQWAEQQAQLADQLFALHQMKNLPPEVLATGNGTFNWEAVEAALKARTDHQVLHVLEKWPETKARYASGQFSYQVRGKTLTLETQATSLSGTKIPKVALPRFKGWGDLVRWHLQENLPGQFPYTAGVFPFKRTGEDPIRMFAGEGGPERTNKRFHYLSKGQPAARLSTAFDSVTLYGEDPDRRPDIYGKIGNSGVNICCLDDTKKLYSGFDLTAPSTSVSMTINGPAAAICAFFMNAAIDQQCERYIREQGLEKLVAQKRAELYGGAALPAYRDALPEGHNGLGLHLLGISGKDVLPAETYEKIKAETLQKVRGTVQADILKEDQAQNTCIFSTEFSLRLMGDMQQYFIDHQVRNFYSVSISGYHMAEAGANPITQLAFTLANGFTYVEYYLARGMAVNDFAPNLSFFFSNGIDPEYAVIGRVARKIWAKAMKLKYGANERSQMLKYHVQTSGRSLHAQEIDFNDIRTTLLALYAIYDNCNSLHTNAFDEAITTPTEASVRRAMAIQLIIQKELGLAKNENPLQGAFIIEELTDLVEEAVLLEFERLTERGGVLGAMETMYQRGKIQEESMHYEMQKHTGEIPVIGVNTFLSSEGSPTIVPGEVIRSTEAEKQAQISTRELCAKTFRPQAAHSLTHLKAVALSGDNTFEALMEAARYCTLGQITHALFEVGGQYRRNM